MEKRYEEAVAKATVTRETEEEYWVRKSLELELDPSRNPTLRQRNAFYKKIAVRVSEVQEEKRRRARERWFGWLFKIGENKVAMFGVVVLVAVGVLMFGTSEAFAGGVSNFISRLLDGGEQIRITEMAGSDIELDITEFEGMYFPTWMIDGYRIAEFEDYTIYKRIAYENRVGEVIYYYICIDSGSLAIDNEEMNETPIFLHDSWGKLIIKENDCTIAWEDGGYIYAIMGPSEMQKDLKKVAECAEKVSMED